MKRKFTEAKKANRPSAFHKTTFLSGHSKKRAKLRGADKKPKGFGCQMLRTQAIRTKANVIKTIYHYN